MRTATSAATASTTPPAMTGALLRPGACAVPSAERADRGETVLVKGSTGPASAAEVAAVEGAGEAAGAGAAGVDGAGAVVAVPATIAIAPALVIVTEVTR